jgi:hypothetical protein
MCPHNFDDLGLRTQYKRSTRVVPCEVLQGGTDNWPYINWGKLKRFMLEVADGKLSYWEKH